ncbi:MAG TPA: AraC family transcriptional regulator [Candidatus Solibacter sp.]|nr:AraC family transcriptional regulator [Candidatus Solibacter sp.]
MFIHFDDTLSDSPFIERIWQCHSGRGGEFLSVAANHFEMVVSRYEGKSFVTIRGPETHATTCDCPAEGDWFGIRFKLGTFIPELAPGCLMDRNDVTLPDASSRAFWWNGSAWEYPTFENADVFVNRLVRKGILVRDQLVDAAVRGEMNGNSLRSSQRHFLRATGLTHCAARQIERARYATILLKQGVSILDTVHRTGYSDQAHLTRSLKYRIGQTPTEIIRGNRQLSYLFKTREFPAVYDREIYDGIVESRIHSHRTRRAISGF